MVLCIIGLIVFGILGIFSAKYRSLAKEAFECVWNRVQFKPCQGTLEDRIRRKILSHTFKISPTLTKYVNRYFEMLSWIFVLLALGSLFLILLGLYNYAVYGNCNGPDSEGFCIFDPFAEKGKEDFCLAVDYEKTTPRYPSNIGGHIRGPNEPDILLLEIGCYTCPYTKKAQAAVEEIVGYYGAFSSFKFAFAFKPFPLPAHENSREAAEAAECAADQGKYWEYHAKLFENQERIKNEGKPYLISLASDSGMSRDQFSSCLESGKYAEKIEEFFQDGINDGIYGTPTFYIGEQVHVGPLSVDEFKKMIEEEKAKLSN